MSRRQLRIAAGAVLTAVLIAGACTVVAARFLAPHTLIAEFQSVTGIYPGDEVRVAGVKVGTVTAMAPEGTHATVTMKVDRNVSIPADAHAVIVAQNLVSARFVQLAPLYTGGAVMADGATIPLDRTAVPVEWDAVKDQLTRLATDLGPHGDISGTAVGRFIESAADALHGNGGKLRQTIAQLADTARIFAEGSGDISATVANLQTFVDALHASGGQLVQFQDRLSTLTAAVDGGRTDLDSALTDLARAVTDVQRFVQGTGDKTSEQVQRLADVTQNLVDHRMDLEQVLHVTPTALANAYNMFDPRTGGASGVFVLNNLSNPTMFICGMVGALENVTAPESAKLCDQYLGPALRTANFNYLPFPFNPFLTAAPSPGKVVYSEPQLAPGAGQGDPPPSPDPAVSAYTVAPGDPPATVDDLLLPPGAQAPAP